MTEKIKLIKMTREDAKGGQTKADVHPDEVENYKKGGWIEAEKSAITENVKNPGKEHPKADEKKKRNWFSGLSVATRSEKDK